jgi:hypothetical protein
MSTLLTQDPTTHNWHKQYTFLNKSHEYGPVDKIMKLAKTFPSRL